MTSSKSGGAAWGSFASTLFLSDIQSVTIDTDAKHTNAALAPVSSPNVDKVPPTASTLAEQGGTKFIDSEIKQWLFQQNISLPAPAGFTLTGLGPPFPNSAFSAKRLGSLDLRGVTTCGVVRVQASMPSG